MPRPPSPWASIAIGPPWAQAGVVPSRTVQTSAATTTSALRIISRFLHGEVGVPRTGRGTPGTRSGQPGDHIVGVTGERVPHLRVPDRRGVGREGPELTQQPDGLGVVAVRLGLAGLGERVLQRLLRGLVDPADRLEAVD